MDCRMPGSSVLLYLPEFAQIHVHKTTRTPGGSDSKESAMLETQVPGLGWSPGEENGYPVTAVFLPGVFRDRSAWQAAVHGVARVGHDWATNTSNLNYYLIHPGLLHCRQILYLLSHREAHYLIYNLQIISVHLPSNILYPLAPGSRLQSRIMLYITCNCHELLVSFNIAKFLSFLFLDLDIFEKYSYFVKCLSNWVCLLFPYN